MVGPNGAGKTTVFKTLAGVLEADGGLCSFEGCPLEALPRRSLGYLAEKPFLYEFFTPLEMLLFENSMRQLELTAQDILAICSDFDMNDDLNQRIARLSQGRSKRVALAAAFMGNPPILVLDEPLNGLDIATVIRLKEKIRCALDAGCCILISSHVLDFFPGLVSRILFIGQGRIVAEVDGENRDLEATYKELFCST